MSSWIPSLTPPASEGSRADRRRGATTILGAWLAWSTVLPLTLSGLLNDWYVDVSSPGCPGSGTQADPFCAIMVAVAAAADGDTIHIAPGTYFENVVLDRDLTLTGTGGRAVTILDGMGSGSVVRVETGSATLTGLTLTNGSGTTGAGYYLPGNYGGGLFAYDPVLFPQVVLDDCSVIANSAGSGGGTYILGHLTLTNSTVSSNSAIAHYSWGGGVYAWGATVSNSTISGNSCYGRTAIGGGINTGELTLESSTVVSNTCSATVCAYGGGVVAHFTTMSDSTVSGNVCLGSYRCVGGGLFIGNPSTIESSTVSENLCSSPDGTAGGGGLAALGSGLAAMVSLTDSRVERNEVFGATAVGGAIWGGTCSGCPSHLSIVNGILSANSAVGTQVARGGGIENQGSVTITNATLSGNSVTSAVALGGAMHLRYSFGYTDLTLRNSVVWGNGVGPITLENAWGGSPTTDVEHSLVEGGWVGAGNIDMDPLFAAPLSGDFSLQAFSPCIDAGDSGAVPVGIDTDIRGFPRFVDDPLTPDTGIRSPWRRTGPGGQRGTTRGPKRPVVDMGAYEFP